MMYNVMFAAAAQWRQDRFVISFWVDPVVPLSRFDAEYTRIADANFTALLGGFGATNSSAVAYQVAAATKAGLVAIPSGCGGACRNASGAWGVQIADEPSAKKFAELAPAVADVKAQGKLAFINLLPNYASPEQFGVATYGEYVAEYMSVVKPNILCTDHYPNFDEKGGGTPPRTNKTKDGYKANMLVLRAASLAALPADVPWWNFFNTMPYNANSAYDVSEAELRWQIWTSVALGAKGVLYFCYWTPPGRTFARGNALMTPRAVPGTPPGTPYAALPQVPSDHYWQAQRINSKLIILGNWLLPMRSMAVAFLAGNASEHVGVPVCQNVISKIS